MNRLVFAILVPTLVLTAACLFSRPAGVSRIRGGSTAGDALGVVNVLTLELPAGELVIAVKYPRPIDTEWYPGFGHSGNGEDVTHWEEIYKVRYQVESQYQELVVHWEYSSRNRKLSCGGQEFDLPPGKLAILSYDAALQPQCELREHTAENIADLRRQFIPPAVQDFPTTPLSDG